jgi:hypothetical protein
MTLCVGDLLSRVGRCAARTNNRTGFENGRILGCTARRLPLPEHEQHLVEEGNEVESYARNLLFAGGIEIKALRRRSVSRDEEAHGSENAGDTSLFIKHSGQ